MIREIFLMVAGFFVFFVSLSQTIALEDFDSPPMTLHNYSGGTGWGGNWYNQNADTDPSGYTIADGSPMIHPEALDPGSYCHGQGTFLSTGRYFDAFGTFQDFAIAENGSIGLGTIYFSFLIRKEADDDNAVEVVFSDAAGQPWQAPDQLIEIGYFGSSSNDMSGTRYWSLAAFNETQIDLSDSEVVIGETFQIIVEIAFGTPTTINMWVNPENGSPDLDIPHATVSTTEDLSFWNLALLFNNTPGSFDEFIFSEDLNTVLPVEYGEFYAQIKRGVVELKWNTISEIANDHFRVERSIDGKQWNPIGSLPGNGDSNEVINYRFVDGNPNRGLNYYRLKQVDYDGASDVSKIVSVDFSVDLEKEIIVYQKSNKLEFLSTEVMKELLVYDLKGTLVSHQFPNENRFSLDLAGGDMYVAVIHTEAKVWRRRILNK